MYKPKNQPHLKSKILRMFLSSVVCVPLLSGAVSMSAYAQNTTQRISLDNVTVFLRGAELFNSGSVRLPAGESEVVFTNVAGRLNEQSLSVSASNGVTILSTTPRNDYLVDEALSPRAQEVQAEIDNLMQQREEFYIQITVLDEQIKVLQANRQLAQSDGRVTAAEVGRMLDLLASRMTSALQQKTRLDLEIVRLNERIQRLQQQLDEERNKGYQPGGQVVVRFYAPQATTSQVRMSYVVNDAGWMPAYDLNVAQIGEPVNMTYKANVFQNTGISWDGVHITLSTGNPSQGVQAPVMSPWYIAVAQPQATSSGLSGSLAASQQLAEYDVAVPAPISPPSPVAMNSRNRVQTNTLDGYVTTNAGGVNTSFDIAIPYTIPSDGKGHMIMIQSAQVPATYQYIVTPKLSTDVFLQASLADWQNLNLLPGVTNVYFENSFVGQGRIDLRQIQNGMDLSLGRDRRIIVERVQDQNNQGTAGFFGGNVQRSYAYTIHMNNTLDQPIELVVRDQLPVSRDSTITLHDLKLAGATHDENTGEVKWTVSLGANEQRSITYSYVVRYPKDTMVVGL